MIGEKMIIIEPLHKVNGVEFGTNRELVRKIFKGKYKEIKKTPISKNTMDSYKDYNLYYTEDNQLEAIEVFGKTRVIVNNKQVFPGMVEVIISSFPQMKPADVGFIDMADSMAITVDPDDDRVVESILFGRKNYYD